MISAGSFIGYMKWDLDRVANMKMDRTAIPPIKDGIHHGMFKGTRWQNEVDVTVQDGRITKIVLVNDVKFSKAGVFDALASEIVNGQTLEVDAVSGATVTTKAYLKAVENALYP